MFKHKGLVTYLFMAALSLATAASTSVMMLPGPMAFTLTLCGAKARAIHLPIKSSKLRPHVPTIRPYNMHAHNTRFGDTVMRHVLPGRLLLCVLKQSHKLIAIILQLVVLPPYENPGTMLHNACSADLALSACMCIDCGQRTFSQINLGSEAHHIRGLPESRPVPLWHAPCLDTLCTPNQFDSMSCVCL